MQQITFQFWNPTFCSGSSSSSFFFFLKIIQHTRKIIEDLQCSIKMWYHKFFWHLPVGDHGSLDSVGFGLMGTKFPISFRWVGLGLSKLNPPQSYQTATCFVRNPGQGRVNAEGMKAPWILVPRVEPLLSDEIIM